MKQKKDTLWLYPAKLPYSCFVTGLVVASIIKLSPKMSFAFAGYLLYVIVIPKHLLKLFHYTTLRAVVEIYKDSSTNRIIGIMNGILILGTVVHLTCITLIVKLIIEYI